MRRWFLSYNSQDAALAQALEAALRRKDAEAQVFFARTSLRAGNYWLPALADEIAEATAFVLLVGAKGLGPWQVLEYYEALDRHVKEESFPVILVLLDGQAAPGLPLLRQLHWIVTSDPSSEQSLAKLMDAACGDATPPGQLWRHTAPYRGLAAMTEADSDFFFGRSHKTVEVVRRLEAAPDKLSVLLGNSGVGKSSLAQAGVMAALVRHQFPNDAANAGLWPPAFHNARQWCFVTMRPGGDPIKALVGAVLETWHFEAGDPRRIRQRNEWAELLLEHDGGAGLSDLLDESQRRYRELNQPGPPAFFVYIDQGEELYVRGESRQRRRFSEILARGLSDRRLRALMSLRADFAGALQNDEPLFEASCRVEVPPLREMQLHEVVSRPAELLSASFETDRLAGEIARRTAEESTRNAGALPLLSYLLDDMWTQMVARGDGVLRLPPQAIELGGVLAERADAFLSQHRRSETALRRLLTLKLATVHADGEPTRRLAARSEFTDDEWRLVCELADHPNRLLVTVAAEGGETYAEVAHEAIFRRWRTLHDWIAQERKFLVWRSGIEVARRTFEAAPERSKADALLMGLALAQARNWLEKRPDDIADADRSFIIRSRTSSQRRKLRLRALVGLLILGLAGSLMAWREQSYLGQDWRWFTIVRPYMASQVRPYVLSPARERALKQGDSFRECAKTAQCPEMVVVPAGSFVMGSPPTEKGRQPSDETQHRVTIARPFAVSKYEVTFADWDACARYGDCNRHIDDSGWGRGRQPVINVTWNDAERYVAWLSKMTGKPYRLLSEAEYEYAARAGTQTAYPWGETIGKANADCNGCGSRWDDRQPAPVGSFAANRFGLYDMVGNVWEWAADCVRFNHHDGMAKDHGGLAAAQGGACHDRAVRSGSWGSTPAFLRSASRNWATSGDRYDSLGFRIGRTILRRLSSTVRTYQAALPLHGQTATDGADMNASCFRAMQLGRSISDRSDCLTLIKPFRALRPAPGRAADVLAPPYDVLSSAEARERAKGKPWSFLHVSKAEIDLAPATDPYDPAVYAKAAENLKRLIAAGVLIRDATPRYYVYRLTWRGRVETGLAAVASLAAYADNRIRRHELTTPAKEDDRVRQIEAVNAQTGPAMLAYRTAPQIDAALAQAAAGAPAVEVTTDDGVRHQLWVVADAAGIESLTRAVDALPALYIADGHHRSAAALRVARARGGQKLNGEDARNYFLAVMFAQAEMTILDYNRVLRDLNGRTPEALLAELRRHYDVEPSERPVRPEAAAEFGMYLDGHWYRLAPRAAAAAAAAAPADPIARLPITHLTRSIIEPIFGVTDPRTDKRIDFVGGGRGLTELERLVSSGAAAVAFALQPTQMSDLMAVADAGKIMPPKSTWFEPKLADGMVSHVLD